MPNLLTNLMLEELSLVDRPANAQAMVSLFKRDNSIEETMEQETKIEDADVSKEEEVVAVEEEAVKSDALVEAEAAVDKLKAENEFLRKSLIDNGYTITAEAVEKKADVEMVEVAGEMIVKSDIPAPVLKALEEATLEKADVALTKSASEALPHFDVEVAKKLVKAFAEDEAIMAALAAADKAFDSAMEEFGKSDADGEFATASDKLESLVKSYMDENKLKKGDYAKAYAAVAKTEEGKALVNKSYKED